MIYFVIIVCGFSLLLTISIWEIMTISENQETEIEYLRCINRTLKELKKIEYAKAQSQSTKNT